MNYSDDELLMLRTLQLLEENRDDVSTGESKVYMTMYYDSVIDLLKQRLFKDAK